MNTAFDMYADSNFDESVIYNQLKYCLSKTDFAALGQKYEGKVRDSYLKGDRRVLITSDRLSCFDVVVTSVPFKGQVLNGLAVDWFKKTESIINNHLIDVPHPNAMLVKNCQILPIEVIVRGYLTGSAWRDYQAGKAISGIQLPAGLKKSQAFEKPLLTPSTKAERGAHDEPISEREIISRGIVPLKIWEEVSEKAQALFKLGQAESLSRGLILVDTKYEFGLIDGKLVLADEIHTLDSSRYWMAESYDQRFATGQDPHMFDKEPARQWLISQGYQGEGSIPEFSDEHRVRIAKHYIKSFELISGKIFEPVTGDPIKGLQSALLA